MERLNGHYGVAAFVLGNTLSSVPFLLLISLISTVIVYFLVDLHHGAEYFFYFVLSLFSCLLVVESLMMAIASLVPNFLMGIIFGAGIQVRFITCTPSTFSIASHVTIVILCVNVMTIID